MNVQPDKRLGLAPHRTAEGASSRSGERGAALVVALVLLLVMTVLGVSGMNTATLELVMTGNSEAQQDAFQAAESGIDKAIAENEWSTTEAVQTSADFGDSSVEATTTNTDCTLYPDSAFSMGVGGVSAWHFEVVSVGTGPRGARATHTQGFYQAGNSC